MEPVYAPHKVLAAQDDDDEDGERGGGGLPATGNRLRAWHSSRIFRVSRASGGKDRHSKVLTAKGLRDRRVRLSVSTAIQFYDLQDRLGYDQPSKAVEWLIKAAADSIAELPSLDSKYPPPPETPKTQQSDDTSGEHQFEECYQQQQQHQMLTNTKSPAACSSNSETSKGSSILSLSRSEIRVKARERARERAAKDKAKDDQESHLAAHQNSHNSSSFTELLTGANNHTTSPPCHQHKHFASGASTQMDYFPSGLLGHRNNFFSGGGGHNNFGMVPPFTTHHQQHHHEMQQFSFLPEHFIPQEAAGAVTGNDYNLNFSISTSGLAAYNRGTLQSNSPPQQQQPQPLQRFPGNQDGPNMPFFIGGNVAASADTQQQFGFDGRLHLCYGGGNGNGDGARHSDIKGKGKT